jgi:hypothetical protein
MGEGGRGMRALPSGALPEYLFKSHKAGNNIRDFCGGEKPCRKNPFEKAALAAR